MKTTRALMALMLDFKWNVQHDLHNAHLAGAIQPGVNLGNSTHCAMALNPTNSTHQAMALNPTNSMHCATVLNPTNSNHCATALNPMNLTHCVTAPNPTNYTHCATALNSSLSSLFVGLGINSALLTLLFIRFPFLFPYLLASFLTDLFCLHF